MNSPSWYSKNQSPIWHFLLTASTSSVLASLDLVRSKMRRKGRTKVARR